MLKAEQVFYISDLSMLKIGPGKKTGWGFNNCHDVGEKNSLEMSSDCERSEERSRGEDVPFNSVFSLLCQ